MERRRENGEEQERTDEKVDVGNEDINEYAKQNGDDGKAHGHVIGANGLQGRCPFFRADTPPARRHHKHAKSRNENQCHQGQRHDGQRIGPTEDLGLRRVGQPLGLLDPGRDLLFDIGDQVPKTGTAGDDEGEGHQGTDRRQLEGSGAGALKLDEIPTALTQNGVNGQDDQKQEYEPPRVCRRRFCLSHAAIA